MKKILAFILCVLLVAGVAYSETIVDGVQKLVDAVLTSPDIDGGTIDNTAIGETTPAVGSFTTMSTARSILPAFSFRSSEMTDDEDIEKRYRKRTKVKS